MAQSETSLSSKVSQKPPLSFMEDNKSVNLSTGKFSLFQVNYNGVFNEAPLRYDYEKVLQLRLSNSKRMAYTEMLDMIVYKLECEIRSMYYCIPRNSLEIGLKLVEGDHDVKKMYDMAAFYGLINLYIAHEPRNLAAYYFKNLSLDDYHGDIRSKLKSHKKLKEDAECMTLGDLLSWEKNESLSPPIRTPPVKPRRNGIEFQGKNLYADFMHADSVDDPFDPLEIWSCEDVIGDVCYDADGVFKGWVDIYEDEVGYHQHSLPTKKKDDFSNEVILEDVDSSIAMTLSMLLKMKWKHRSKFTRMRAIINSSKMVSLRKSTRQNYGRVVNVVGLNEKVPDYSLDYNRRSCNNDLKDVD